MNLVHFPTRILVLLMFSIIFNYVYSQNHMKFIDIPIDGNIKSFEDSLIVRGYKLSAETNSYYNSICKTYNGVFLDYPLCSIDIIASKNDSVVNTISVDISKYRLYKSNILNYYKELYGDPIYNKSGDDKYEWIINEGIIRIVYSNSTDWFRVMFIDKINDNKKKEITDTNATTERVPNEHLLFMNIPLDGKIGAFHNKMLSKGLKISDINKQLGKGFRAYEGTFARANALICICYDIETHLVYAAIVTLLPMSKDDAISKDIELTSSFKKKYGRKHVVRTEVNIDDFTDGLIDQTNVYLDEGEINIKLFVDDKSTITIYYFDKKNTKKVEEKKKNDILNDI